jgi:hypothetical protein
MEVRSLSHGGLHDEGELGFDARSYKTFRWHEAAIGKEHIIQQHAGIRLVDIERALHRPRGEADLVTFDHAARGDLHLHPRLLDRIGVVDGDAGMIQRYLPDLQLRFLGLIEPFGGDADLVGGERHGGPAKKGGAGI